MSAEEPEPTPALSPPEPRQMRIAGLHHVTALTRDLEALTREVDAAVGPFPAFTHELAASVRAHLAE